MKRLMTGIIICVLLTTGCSSSSNTGNKALDGELKLESDQSLLVAQVTSIFGNEITLALAKEVDVSQMKGQTQEQSKGETQEQRQSSVQDKDSPMTNGENTNEETDAPSQNSTKVSSGRNSDNEKLGNASSGSSASEDMSLKDMPTGDRSSGGNGPDIEDSEKDNSNSDKKAQIVRYSLTGEEITMMIPVGTPVTTLLGTITTFSRIAVDNTLKIVTEKNANGEDTIVAIYIVG